MLCRCAPALVALSCCDAVRAGSITFDEWIGFWVNVLKHGYEPDDLEEEVRRRHLDSSSSDDDRVVMMMA